MPWCAACSRFLNPNTVATDGSCPSCGRAVEVAERPEQLDEPSADESLDETVDDEGVRAPWHFWLMVSVVGLYLGWRLIQGIFWAAHHWF